MTPPLVGVSSWAVHQALGAPAIFGVDAGETIPGFAPPADALPLIDLPARLAAMGFDALQICHFHLPARDPGYLADLRGAIAAAGLPLHALLVDAGDVTHPVNADRDRGWIAGWLPVAAALGAAEVRVIAGKTTGEGALVRSAAALRELAARARDLGVALTTENWFDLLATPAAVDEVLDRCAGEVRFLLDFGNWSGPDKAERLGRVAPRASSCHAQADFTERPAFDETDYRACLRLPYAEGFRGPFVLVNGGWTGIAALRDFIRGELTAPAGQTARPAASAGR